MPEKKTIQRAQRAKREGKPPTTQAGEFVREEMHHIREGKHGARSRAQAIAIGLSKARSSGVKLPPPGPKKAKARTRKSAAAAYRRGQAGGGIHKPKTKPRRAAAVRKALRRERRSV
jgi:uncharacterized protein DUF6496